MGNFCQLRNNILNWLTDFSLCLPSCSPTHNVVVLSPWLKEIRCWVKGKGVFPGILRLASNPWAPAVTPRQGIMSSLTHKESMLHCLVQGWPNSHPLCQRYCQGFDRKGQSHRLWEKRKPKATPSSVWVHLGKLSWLGSTFSLYALASYCSQSLGLLPHKVLACHFLQCAAISVGNILMAPKRLNTLTLAIVCFFSAQKIF